MHSYLLKLRYLLLPFLGCLMGFMAVYTLLHWLLVIKLDWIDLDKGIVEWFAPMGIAFLLAVTLLRRGMRRLHFKNEKSSDFLYLILTFGLAIPVVIAQTYLSTATGKLTALAEISQIDRLPKTKYYTLREYYFAKNSVSIKVNTSVSGKYNDKLDFYVYTVVPIVRKANDTTARATHYWLCKRYSDQMSNYASDAQKESQYKAFLQRCELEFRHEGFPFRYLERIMHDKELRYYTQAADVSPWSRNGTDVFLQTCEGDFAQRNGKSFGWIFKSTGIALVVLALLLLCFPLKTASQWKAAQKKIRQQKAISWKEKYDYLLPGEGFLITPLLLYANTLVFLVMMTCGLGIVSFDGEDLYRWGALYRSGTMQSGHWWRLLSYMFLHGGILHIFNNMISLYFVGLFLEPILGKWRYLALYLFGGIVAGFTSLYWHDHVNTVGASGAIFALYGCLLAFVATRVTPPESSKLFLWIASISVGLSLVMGLFGNADNATHIGGLLCGFVIGFLLSGRIQEEMEER